MLIEGIQGIKTKFGYIAEDQMANYNVVSTAKTIEDFFEKYGYSFVSISYKEADAVIVKDNDRERELMTKTEKYALINYKTGEVLQNNFPAHEAHNAGSATKEYIRNNSNQDMTYIAPDVGLIIIHNLPYIIDMEEGESYPLLKQEPIFHQGIEGLPFVDVRNHMYFLHGNEAMVMDLTNLHIPEFVKKFPFGQLDKGKLILTDCPLCYGIRVSHSDLVNRTAWYASREKRDSYLNIMFAMNEDCIVQEQNKQKIFQFPKRPQ